MCGETAPDHQCVTGLCLKPINSDAIPFCTIDCTDNTSLCEAPLVCEKTPRPWYCRNPFE